jgi:hypothetical protein
LQTYVISPTDTPTAATSISKSTVTWVDADATAAFASCTLTYTIEFYDYELLTWTQITDANKADYNFIVASPSDNTFFPTVHDATTNAFEIATTKADIWAGKSVLMRLRV